jgi:excisionase family DNA binding protein
MSETSGVILPVSLNHLREMITEAVSAGNGQRNLQKVENEKKEILTIQEAAEFLNLEVSSIYTLTHKRTIPFIKKGKKLHFLQSELKKWLLSGEKPVINP